MGYINGELRFWLGWAQDVAGDHAAAQESWRQARRELEPFLKEQPDHYTLIGDLALTNMGLGDKAAALALSEQAIAVNPIEKDAIVSDRDSLAAQLDPPLPSTLCLLARRFDRLGCRFGKSSVIYLESIRATSRDLEAGDISLARTSRLSAKTRSSR